MRLIDTSTIRLINFEVEIPEYAILSHRWEEEEITFSDIIELSVEELCQKKGYKKIELLCEQAKKDGISYAWSDTCCFDKRSSSELQESIGSMFEYYKRSKECYAYLSDVDLSDGELNESKVPASFKSSVWFQRGWTLQELIAPKTVRFFDTHFLEFGTKESLMDSVQEVTGIDRRVLQDSTTLSQFSVASRMSWAANRVTTRPEDIAYCLFGIFGIRMPVDYGEGSRAFIRLQEEILKEIYDDSILAWNFDDEDIFQMKFFENIHESFSWGILAKHPCFFKGLGNVQQAHSTLNPWILTSVGIQISKTLWCSVKFSEWNIQLQCFDQSKGRDHCFIVPVEFTSRKDIFGRRRAQISTMPTMPTLSTVSDTVGLGAMEDKPIPDGLPTYYLYDEVIYLSRTEYPTRIKLKKSSRSKSSLNETLDVVLHSAVRIDRENQVIGILPADGKQAIVAQDVAFILLYKPDGSYNFETWFQILILSRYERKSWYLICRGVSNLHGFNDYSGIPSAQLTTASFENWKPENFPNPLINQSSIVWNEFAGEEEGLSDPIKFEIFGKVAADDTTQKLICGMEGKYSLDFRRYEEIGAIKKFRWKERGHMIFAGTVLTAILIVIILIATKVIYPH